MMGGKKSGRGLQTCEIALLDQSSFQQVYKRSALGQDVFDAVCRTLEVLEVEYFGLQFDTDTGPAWLDLTKPIRKQAPATNNGTIHLEFRVKFFVRNPNQLQDEYTRYLFALQLRRDIFTKRLPCDHQMAAKLLAILVQGEFGDYDADEHTPGYSKDIQLITPQTDLLSSDAEAHHQSAWCRGLTPADCDFMLVDLARRLPFYGTEKYPLVTARPSGYSYEIAVSHEGVSVLLFNERQNTFSWPCIATLKYKKKKFTMHLRGITTAPLLFLFPSSKQCKRFWQFALEYHTFFRRLSPPQFGTRKRRSIIRSGSKYRFSGRTQSQIIKEIRTRNDVVLHSERDRRCSASPSFKRFSSSRLSSVKRGIDRRAIRPSSPTSLTGFEFVPAVTVTMASPGNDALPELDMYKDPKKGAALPSRPVITKTEVASTKQESTVEERRPTEIAMNNHMNAKAKVPAIDPPVELDDDRTPMNLTPREAGAMERTFSNDLREGQLSDLSELVRRFSTPDFSVSRPETVSPASDTEHRGSQGALQKRSEKLTTTMEGVKVVSDADGDGDDDRTPAVSADESSTSPPGGTLDKRRNVENLNRSTGNNAHRSHRVPPPYSRPISNSSDGTISDSSDDNVSMTDERRFTILKRRLSRRSKKKPTTKSFYIAQELRDTERSYIADLDMLNVKFRNAIQAASALPEEKINELFQQLAQLQEFHVELMVELENRMILWEGRSADHDPADHAYIGDIMARRMAEMRIYTPYIVDQSRILGQLQHWADENGKFRDLYSTFESHECHLPLLEFFNRPMQRMVHYKLLLDRLIKAYDPGHPDVVNLKAALLAVTDAADYTNRQCKLSENEKKLLELQQELSGIENLVKKGRNLVREGRLLKVGRNGPQQRHFLLFNDLLLYVAPRAIGLPQVKSTISLKDARVEVCEDGNPYGENAFSLFTRNKSFFLIARSVKERDVWVEDIHSSIEDTNGILDSSRAPSVSDLGQISLPSQTSSMSSEDVILAAPLLLPFEMYDSCQRCSAEFSLTKRKHHCGGCGRVMCNTCLKHSVHLPFYGNEKKRRACRDCYEKFHALHSEPQNSQLIENFTRGVSRKPHASPTHSYGSSGKLMIPENAQYQHLQLGSRSSLSTINSDEASLWSSDTTSRSGSVRMSVPNGLDLHGGESLTQLSELPNEGQGADGVVEEQPQQPGEESPGLRGRMRAQTMDPQLSRPGTTASFRSTSGQSPFKRHTSLRYDSKRQRRKRSGIMDDESMVSSVANHMSGHLLCKIVGYDEQRWKKLWVVCTSYSLFLYKTHHETKPVCTIALPEYELGLIGPDDGYLCELPHSFKLTSESTVNCFVADSSHCLDRWLEVVKNCRAAPNSGGSTLHLISV